MISILCDVYLLIVYYFIELNSDDFDLLFLFNM